MYLDTNGNSQVTATISGNTINTLASGSDGIDLNAYDSSHLTTFINNNHITTPQDTAVTIYSDDSSVLCSDMMSNSLNAGGGNFDIKLDQAVSGTLNIVDYPNLGANNGGASVTVAGGVVTNVAGCP